MEREIKFREFVNGKFHYWGFVQEGIFKGPVTPSLTRGKHSQSTGLKDKNGKEIYEGDIVRSETYEVLGVVKWSYEHWAPFQYYMSMVEEDFEVIGNIYEHPDLLNPTSPQP